jgi:hypothetical protein
MRLQPLYRLRFAHPEGWTIDLNGEVGTESAPYADLVLDVAEVIWETIPE